MRHKGLLCAAAHDVFYTVKFKPLAIATCWLLASSLLFAAPEDDQVTGSKRAIEKLNLIQLGDQVKTSVSEKTNLMLGQAMTGLDMLQNNLDRAAQLISSFKHTVVSQVDDNLSDFEVMDTVRTLLLLFFPGISLFLIKYLT